MKIVTREFSDNFQAWQAADQAARLGLRVVSVVAAPPPNPEMGFFPPKGRWHVYVEAHLEFTVQDWDDAIFKAQQEVR